MNKQDTTAIAGQAVANLAHAIQTGNLPAATEMAPETWEIVENALDAGVSPADIRDAAGLDHHLEGFIGSWPARPDA
jgi:hypothetical protein